MPADIQHLTLGCRKSFCFPEEGFLAVFGGVFRAAVVKFLHKGKANS